MESSDPASVTVTDPVTAGKPWYFEPETARRAGARSGESRRSRAAVRRETQAALERIARSRPDLLTEDVGILARAAAVRIAGDIATGGVTEKNLHHAAAAVRYLVDVARIEAGQPTELRATVTAAADDFRAWLDEVRSQAALRAGE
jgi:hypothetical protein